MRVISPVFKTTRNGDDSIALLFFLIKSQEFIMLCGPSLADFFVVEFEMSYVFLYAIFICKSFYSSSSQMTGKFSVKGRITTLFLFLKHMLTLCTTL